MKDDKREQTLTNVHTNKHTRRKSHTNIKHLKCQRIQVSSYTRTTVYVHMNMQYNLFLAKCYNLRDKRINTPFLLNSSLMTSFGFNCSKIFGKQIMNKTILLNSKSLFSFWTFGWEQKQFSTTSFFALFNKRIIWRLEILKNHHLVKGRPLVGLFSLLLLREQETTTRECRNCSIR